MIVLLPVPLPKGALGRSAPVTRRATPSWARRLSGVVDKLTTGRAAAAGIYLGRHWTASAQMQISKGGYPMAFETLKCANCGSVDVQEVKPGTYFCDHCESVFKHVDPTRVTVGPAFCDHGNPVLVQCQVCGTGMCPEQCDVVPAWAYFKYAGIVRTQGFGYVEYRQCYDQDVDEPFLSVSKLLTSLARTRKDKGKGTLSHVCYECVIQAVPAAAEHISAGAICETVRCWGMPTGKCPCCQGSFCRECSMPETLNGHGAHDDLRGLGYRSRGNHVTICAWDPERDHWSKTFTVGVPTPDGMCRPCLMENDDKVASIAAGICRQSYAGKLVPVNEYNFKVPAASVRRKKYYEERGRVEELAGRCAAEISARLSELVTLDGNCHRDDVPVGKFLPYAEYAIVDERDRVRLAAVSKVIWAKPVSFENRRDRLSR